MTYLDKYKEENPGLSEEAYQRKVAESCPHHPNGYLLTCPRDLLGYSDASLAEKCRMCWNQEIPGTEPANTKTIKREDKTMNKNFTKDDIKVGYVVKYRNGHVAMAMPTHSCGGEKLITALRAPLVGWADLGDYTDDMRVSNKDYDIMEVYGYSKYAHKCIDVSTDFRELLWKREEKPKKTCDSCAHKVVCTHVGMCEHYMEK